MVLAALAKHVLNFGLHESRLLCFCVRYTGLTGPVTRAKMAEGNHVGMNTRNMLRSIDS
jgi:hypothetical protein